jgi:hypothetical protein
VKLLKKLNKSYSLSWKISLNDKPEKEGVLRKLVFISVNVHFPRLFKIIAELISYFSKRLLKCEINFNSYHLLVQCLCHIPENRQCNTLNSDLFKHITKFESGLLQCEYGG